MARNGRQYQLIDGLHDTKRIEQKKHDAEILIK